MEIEIKRGDEFSLDITRVDANGNPVDITGQTVTSQVKITGFTTNLTVTVVDAPVGKARLSAPASATALWPIATLSCDVKYDGGGGAIRRSRTFKVRVVQEITT